METPALVLITAVWTSVTFATGYFFYKILTAPKKPEPDSYSDNDEE